MPRPQKFFPTKQPCNRLLKSIGTSTQQASVLRDLIPVEIQAREELRPTGPHADDVFFPAGAVISLLYTAGASSLDVYGVGCEGMIGAGGVLEGPSGHFNLICQIGGPMLSMPLRTFEKHARNNASLRQAVQSYERTAISGIIQCVVCNAHHSIARRTARFLLVSSDRAGSAAFEMTHESLARMLGVGRSGVSLAVARLQAQGLVRSIAGRVTILNRKGLMRVSCDCYGA